MEKINKDKLKELLEKEKVEVAIASKYFENTKDTYDLGFIIDFCFSENGNLETKYK